MKTTPAPAKTQLHKSTAFACISVAAAASFLFHANLPAQSWNKTAAGPYSWSDNANWGDGSGAFPNSAGATASINTALTANQTINLGGNVTVGSLSLGSASAGLRYTLALGSNTLTLDNGGSEATITSLAGGLGSYITGGTINITDGGLRIFTQSGASLTVGISSATAITGTGNLTLHGASEIRGTINNTGSITAMDSAGSNTGTATVTANIGANVTEIIVNRPSATLALSGNNTNFAGNVDVQSGSFRVASTTALNSKNVLNLSGGGVDVRNNVTIAGLTGAGRVTNSSGAGTQTITLGGSGTYSFTHSNQSDFSDTNVTSLKVAMDSTGSQTIAGYWTKRGGIEVASGKLVLGGADVFSGTGGAYSMGTLLIGGGTLSSNQTNVNVATHSHSGMVMQVSLASGTLDLNETGVGSMTLGNTTSGNPGSSFLISGGTWKLTIESISSFDKIIGKSNGSFSITGGTIDLTGGTINYASTYQILSGFGSGSVSDISFTGYDSTNYSASLNSSGELSFSAIPEPSTFGLLFVGSLAAALASRLRRRVQNP